MSQCCSLAHFQGSQEPIHDEAEDHGGDEDDEGSVIKQDSESINIEETFGWPRDLIRQRRLEIIVETVTHPSDRIQNMITSMTKRPMDQSDDEGFGVLYDENALDAMNMNDP